MPSRKRGSDEMEAAAPPAQPSLLQRLRSMWEFANIMQFIYLFGKVLKIDEDFDIEVPSPPSPAPPCHSRSLRRMRGRVSRCGNIWLTSSVTARISRRNASSLALRPSSLKLVCVCSSLSRRIAA